jgi:hypothetical protein
VCGGAAAIEELIDATDCSFWEFIVIYRKLITKQMLRRDTATGLVSLGASATARTCPDPAMVAQARIELRQAIAASSISNISIIAHFSSENQS